MVRTGGTLGGMETKGSGKFLESMRVTLTIHNLSRLQDVLGQWCSRTCGGGQPMSGLPQGPLHKREPMAASPG